MSTVACHLDATPAAGGIVGLALTLTNGGDRPVTLELPEPFTAFSLRAWVDGTEVSVAIPPTSLQLQVVPRVLDPGRPLALAIPVYLRFAPGAQYDPGEDMFCWSLVAAPGPLELEARVSLEGVDVAPCRARVERIA
jgi:hypothetical protein